MGTQVRAFLPVWGRRMVYYDAYLDCLHNDGLEERIISTTAWHPANTPAAYTGEAVTAHAFEAELASRVASELRYALRKFLVAYSLVALEEFPPLNRLYGCFLLTAPGRVTYAAPPEPVLAGMLNQLPFPTAVKKERIEQVLKFGVRELDGYLSQILAMHRLAKQGEPSSVRPAKSRWSSVAKVEMVSLEQSSQPRRPFNASTRAMRLPLPE